MSSEDYLELMLAEIISGVPKSESLFVGESGFDEAWDGLAADVAAQPGSIDIPGEVE